MLVLHKGSLAVITGMMLTHEVNFINPNSWQVFKWYSFLQRIKKNILRWNNQFIFMTVQHRGVEGNLIPVIFFLSQLKKDVLNNIILKNNSSFHYLNGCDHACLYIYVCAPRSLYISVDRMCKAKPAMSSTLGIFILQGTSHKIPLLFFRDNI